MEVPEYFVGGYYGAGGDQFSPEKRHADQKHGGEPFAIDDLLDFSNADAIMSDGFFDNAAGNSTDSSAVTAVDSCNSSNSGNENHFPAGIVPRAFSGDAQLSGGELCVPYDDMAELEWLSNFVEDSFSAEEDLKTLQLLSGGAAAIGGVKPQTPESSSSSDTLTPPFDARNAPFLLHPETPLPGKARSKRSRAAPGDWSTRLLHLATPPPSAAEPKPPTKSAATAKRREANAECTGRKCLHCGTEKTPQWRTGPMGPKTLCNACGVRFKSGRLVPEYRPAASPTFVSTKHSNSHRKVLELRRQKEMHRHQQHHHHQQLMSHQASIFGVSNGGDDFLIHHHHHPCGPDFRHVI